MLLAAVYVTAAVLSVYLAVTMFVWWPVILVSACLLAAVACVLAARRAERVPKPPSRLYY
jgi:hypothetical protein